MSYSMKNFSNKELHSNSLANNIILMEDILSIDFTSKTEEEFIKCLEAIDDLNKAQICELNCESKRHYENTMMEANVNLKLFMIFNRLGI